MNRPRVRRHLITVAGADLHEGDTFVDPQTGRHTVGHLDVYPGRTYGDGMRHAHCTDGTCCTVRDHATYQLLAA